MARLTPTAMQSWLNTMENEMKEADAIEALRQWHRDTCYPNAEPFELQIGLDAILAALTPRADRTDQEAIERCAKIADDEITRCFQTVNGHGSNTAKRIRDAILALRPTPPVENDMFDVWTTQKGQKIPLSEMTVKHLLNSRNYMEKQALRAKDLNDEERRFLFNGWVAALSAELNRR